MYLSTFNHCLNYAPHKSVGTIYGDKWKKAHYVQVNGDGVDPNLLQLKGTTVRHLGLGSGTSKKKPIISLCCNIL